MFNPEPIINLWFNDKVQRLTASSHRGSKMKHQKCDTEFVDMAELPTSDLENESDAIFEWFS